MALPSPYISAHPSYHVLLPLIGVGSPVQPQRVSACLSITALRRWESQVPISVPSDFQGIVLQAKPAILALNAF